MRGHFYVLYSVPVSRPDTLRRSKASQGLAPGAAPPNQFAFVENVPLAGSIQRISPGLLGITSVTCVAQLFEPLVDLAPSYRDLMRANLARLPNLRLDPAGEDVHIHGDSFRSPTHLPVLFG